MPSNSDPDTFGRGWPTVSTASRWMCGSTSGGVTRRPPRSMVSAAAVLVADGDDHALVYPEIGERVLSGNPGIAKNQIDHLAIMAEDPPGAKARG